MIKLECLTIAKLVALGYTMNKRNARQNLIARVVELDSTMIKQQSLIANLIAMPDHTSHLTKAHVLFVRKVSGKIKIDSQIVKVVDL